MLNAALAVLVFATSGAAAIASGILVSFSTRAVHVAGAQDGSTLYTYSIAREPRGFFSEVVERETLLVAGRAGDAVWPIDRDIPLRSVWLVFEKETGRFAAAPAPGYPARSVTLTEENFVRDRSGEIGQLHIRPEGSLVQFGVMRPGVGLWRSTVPANGQLDEDTNTRTITVSVSRLEKRLGTAANAPAELVHGDVVFMIDPGGSVYEYYMGEVHGLEGIPVFNSWIAFALAGSLVVTGILSVRAA